MKIINENPYRILGVYVNSPRRDVFANKSRATALLRVSRPVEFPMDLNGVLPPLLRTLDIMNEAESNLAIAKEQIKHAQFWFLKMTPLDDVAFNHLQAGQMDEATKIWKRKDSLSSLQNRMICFFIKDNVTQALALAEQLYIKYGNDYIQQVSPTSTLKMDYLSLIHQFIDSLLTETDPLRLFKNACDQNFKNYIRKSASEPLIGTILNEVSLAKNVDRNNAKERFDAAQQLINATHGPLTKLKSILPQDNPQYIMVADRLGLEILQCGIDYFINSNNERTAPKAMIILKKASLLVVGTLAKQRCEDNISQLQKFIDNLPPEEVMVNDSAIKAKISVARGQPETIAYAVALLNNARPHLETIKSKVGAGNRYYIRISTSVVSCALHKVIEEVNAVQSDPQIAMRLQLGLRLDSVSLNKIKSTIHEAWKATIMMDDFEMEPDFRSHYIENRNKLKSMCRDLSVSICDSTPPSTPEPEPEESSFWKYMKSENSSNWQAALILNVIVAIIGYSLDKSYIGLLWGLGIGAIAWLFVLYDMINGND